MIIQKTFQKTNVDRLDDAVNEFLATLDERDYKEIYIGEVVSTDSGHFIQRVVRVTK